MVDLDFFKNIFFQLVSLSLLKYEYFLQHWSLRAWRASSKGPGSGKTHQIWKKGARRSHLDTISLREGKHLRHSSQHIGLQRSEVMMTNEWPRSPERPKEEPLESFSRGTGDIFLSPEATNENDCRFSVQDPTCGSERPLWAHKYRHNSKNDPCQSTAFHRLKQLNASKITLIKSFYPILLRVLSQSNELMWLFLWNQSLFNYEAVPIIRWDKQRILMTLLQ